MPGTRSARTPRKLGRDFMRAYQSLAGGRDRPVQFADKIQRRQMRGGGEIRQRQGAAGEPFPGLGQPADVVEVVAQRGVAGADRRRVGIAAAGQPAEVFFAV